METDSIDRVITRLEELSRDRELEKVIDIITDITISGKYDFNDILDFDSRIIEYLSLSIQLEILNCR